MRTFGNCQPPRVIPGLDPGIFNVSKVNTWSNYLNYKLYAASTREIHGSSPWMTIWGLIVTTFVYLAMISVLIRSAIAMDEKIPFNRQKTVRVLRKEFQSGLFDSSSDAKVESSNQSKSIQRLDSRRFEFGEMQSRTKSEEKEYELYCSESKKGKINTVTYAWEEKGGIDAKESSGMKKAGGGSSDLHYAFQLSGFKQLSCSSFENTYQYYPGVIKVLHNEFPPEMRMPIARFCLSLIDLETFNAAALIEFLIALKPSDANQWLDKFEGMTYEVNQSTYGQLCDAFSLVAHLFKEKDYYELYRIAPAHYPNNASLSQKMDIIRELAEKFEFKSDY